MVVLGQAPGARLASKRSLEAIKHLGPVGERALAVLASAMEDRSVPGSCRCKSRYRATKGANLKTTPNVSAFTDARTFART
jgi:hypothetical protein